MKLNKNGWGIATMIIFMSILLLFLVIVTIMIYRFYVVRTQIDYNLHNSTTKVSNPNNNVNSIYRSYENSIKQNAITYIYTYYENNLIDNSVKITVDNMVNKKIMENIIDPKDNSICSGYAIVEIVNNKIVSTPYLKCANYETDGYE